MDKLMIRKRNRRIFAAGRGLQEQEGSELSINGSIPSEQRCREAKEKRDR